MRKLGWFLFVLLMIPGSSIVFGQDSCAAMQMARDIDAMYNDYIATRSFDDADAALRAAEEFNYQLGTVIETCGGASSNDGSQAGRALGTGTEDDPYGFGQEGLATNGTIIKPIDFKRGAAELVGEESPGDGTEWAVVVIEIQCDFTSRQECEADHSNFRLVGDSDVEYDAELALNYPDRINARIPPGGKRTMGVPFKIDPDEANMILRYYPGGFAAVDQPITYHRAQASLEVTATARIVVREGPGGGYTALDTLNDGDRTVATGRIEDNSWIRVDGGWVAAVNTTITPEMLELLPIIEME